MCVVWCVCVCVCVRERARARVYKNIKLETKSRQVQPLCENFFAYECVCARVGTLAYSFI